MPGENARQNDVTWRHMSARERWIEDVRALMLHTWLYMEMADTAKTG